MKELQSALLIVLCLAFSAKLIGQTVDLQADIERSKQVCLQYSEARDKRGFLLDLVTSDNEVILLWVAKELGQFSDKDVVAALGTLRQHRQRNRDLPSVAGAARESIEKVETATQIDALNADASFDSKEAIVRAMALGTNEYARLYGLRFLLANADGQTRKAVPLLAELYPYERQARQLIKKHPRLAQSAVRSGIQSQKSYIAEACIGLVAELEMEEALPDLMPFMHLGRDNIQDSSLRLKVLSTVRTFRDKAVPHLDDVLNDASDPLSQFDAVQELKHIGTSKAKQSLLRAREREKRKKKPNATFIQNIDKAVHALGGATDE